MLGTIEELKTEAKKRGYKVMSSTLGHVAMDRSTKWFTPAFKKEEEAWSEIFKRENFSIVSVDLGKEGSPGKSPYLDALRDAFISRHSVPQTKILPPKPVVPTKPGVPPMPGPPVNTPDTSAYGGRIRLPGGWLGGTWIGDELIVEEAAEDE